MKFGSIRVIRPGSILIYSVLLVELSFIFMVGDFTGTVSNSLQRLLPILIFLYFAENKRQKSVPIRKYRIKESI